MADPVPFPTHNIEMHLLSQALLQSSCLFILSFKLTLITVLRHLLINTAMHSAAAWLFCVFDIHTVVQTLFKLSYEANKPHATVP